MTPPPALVSVIVPAFNVAEVVERAVRSALGQSHRAVEVIAVDDASTDGTAAVLADLAAEDGRVRVVRLERNEGPGAARAAGLARARGDWVAVLDADDVLDAERLARLLAVAGRDRLDAIADNLELVDPGLGASVGPAFPLGADDRFTLTPERFLKNGVPGGRVNLGWMKPMVSRHFLAGHRIAWRPLRHAEDFLFTMELLLAGARFDLVGWSGYRYTQRRGTASGAASRHSRTTRSAAEQMRAVELLLSRDELLPPRLAEALVARKAQIAVTAAVLDAIDAARAGRPLDAGRAVLGALARPRALLQCLSARFGPGARRLRA